MVFLLFIGFLIAVAWIIFQIIVPVSRASESAADLLGCLWAGILVFVIAVVLMTFGHC